MGRSTAARSPRRSRASAPRGSAPKASLGGQAVVPGCRRACGRILTDNVNGMASKPDGAGAQHRRRPRPAVRQRATCRRRSTVDAQRRGARAQEHDQRHGSISSTRSPRRSRAFRRREGSARKGKARADRREGGGGPYRGVVEGSDRQRQLHGRPNLTGQVRNNRRGHDGRRQPADPRQEDHRRRQRRDPRAQEHHQHDGSISCASFASEVTRRGRAKVGTEGKLGGQALVPRRRPARGRI